MKFYTNKRSQPTVPIISLIDILAILLIFFIATTTFKQKEALVNVALPKSSEMASSSERQLRTTLAVSKDEQIYLGEQMVTLETLTQALRDLKQRQPELKLQLKVDKGVELGMVVKVWDEVRKAKIEISDIPLRILTGKKK
ncbi:MAG: biopolymer transporter ExbD [Verrucomicrobiales bacterium]|nr:biopolymer transporter ExbD [Verrucomicrobiales bacterium]